MLRYVSEAVSIQELLPTLNSKEELGNSNMPRRRRNNNNRFLKDRGAESALNAIDYRTINERKLSSNTIDVLLMRPQK